LGVGTFSSPILLTRRSARFQLCVTWSHSPFAIDLQLRIGNCRRRKNHPAQLAQMHDGGDRASPEERPWKSWERNLLTALASEIEPGLAMPINEAMSVLRLFHFASAQSSLSEASFLSTSLSLTWRRILQLSRTISITERPALIAPITTRVKSRNLKRLGTPD